jgi:hypothetical protein
LEGGVCSPYEITAPTFDRREGENAFRITVCYIKISLSVFSRYNITSAVKLSS